MEIGDRSPNFSCPDETGKIRTLKEFSGRKLVLFFYPHDSTPTCTQEVCNLRDNYSELRQKGYEILGISPDSVQKHKKFIEKNKLPFSLLADENSKMARDFSVFGSKKFMGRVFDGVYRTTFLIDEKGKIEQIIRKVKAKIHASQILENSRND